MPLTVREEQQLEIAKGIPADVLAMAAKHQAENNMLSEGWCTSIGDAWHEAAEIARIRRTTPVVRSDANLPFLPGQS